jgi:hypothetical protein
MMSTRYIQMILKKEAGPPHIAGKILKGLYRNLEDGLGHGRRC